MQEKENILSILSKTKEAIKKQDSILLREYSNQTIHTASISQDPDNIAIAVIVYSLSKIIERKTYHEFKAWDSFYNKIILLIDNLINGIKKENDKLIKDNLKSINSTIRKLSGNLKKYIMDVFRKASINKASRIYEHGISMEKTASLLGITIFELAGYTGQTDVSDIKESRTLEVKSRIKLAMEMFK